MKSKVAAVASVRTGLQKGAVEKVFDLGVAWTTFEATCTQCHKLSNVEKSPPASAQEARELVARMVDNGLEAPEQDLEQIVFYLSKTYAK